MRGAVVAGMLAAGCGLGLLEALPGAPAGQRAAASTAPDPAGQELAAYALAADPPLQASRSFEPARAALRPPVAARRATRPPAPAPPAAPAVQRTTVQVPLPGGRLEQLLLADPADPARRERVLVWHPPGSDSSRIPVVYWLHGVPGTPEDFLTSGYVAAVARAVVTGQIAPVVLAFPDGNSARHADTEWADSASGDQDLATLVSTGVVSAVESGAPRPAALRTVAGFSMGGYGAADIALHHPGVFGSLVSLEGYFHVDDPSGVLGHDPAALAGHTPLQDLGALGSRPVYLADYTDDIEPVVAGESQRLAGLLAARGATYQLTMVPGSGHSLAPLAALWPGIEQFLQRTAWNR